MKPTSVLGLLLALPVLAGCGDTDGKIAEGADTTEQTATDEQAKHRGRGPEAIP